MKMSTARKSGVLVSDFDGTMTRHDFYKLAIESLLPPETVHQRGLLHGDVQPRRVA